MGLIGGQSGSINNDDLLEEFNVCALEHVSGEYPIALVIICSTVK